jgi:predicted N-acyltransferase
MNTERIRELAEQAGDDWDHTLEEDKEFLKKFAELIVAEERNRTWTQSHWTEYERKIVAAEREACAKMCEYLDAEYEGEDVLGTWCADAIRARGNE